MLDFDELEATLKPEAYVVTGAGSPEIDGIYEDAHVQVFGAPIFRHTAFRTHLLSREKWGERHGWLLGANRQPFYGARTEALDCPKVDWRAFNGKQPAPTVEGFSSLADACLRLADVWCLEADRLAEQSSLRQAADVLKRAGGLPILPDARLAEIHARRARTFRRLAESQKRAEVTLPDGKAECGDHADACANVRETDPLHGLAAEWSVEAAEEACRYNPRCYDALWEGAVAAKHIGWWSKGQALAKRAMEAVPAGPEHRTRRETASTLFLLMAEEEEAEKRKKLREMKASQEMQLNKVKVTTTHEDLEWALAVATRLNDLLKEEDFRRPHHQLWKCVGPGMAEEDSKAIFDDIRDLVWRKWNDVAWQHGYWSSYSVDAKKKFCGRIVDAANANASASLAADVHRLMREMEDRICLHWPDIPEAVHKPTYDETWALTMRPDGTWGTWNSSTTT
eukprot:TRINITY_DN5896_c0_g1_i1.p1 TRINITY_DN5896_c0_g1~~TRINITY_DN5896_c0_g1_i1.p1  ORF type:complete len:453 (+),score=78.77 TRINITY_DN5896_c0_g1_i1:46-1404(+)